MNEFLEQETTSIRTLRSSFRARGISVAGAEQHLPAVLQDASNETARSGANCSYEAGVSSLTVAERQVLPDYVQERTTHCLFDTRDGVIQGLLARDTLRIELDVEGAGGEMCIFKLRPGSKVIGQGVPHFYK